MPMNRITGHHAASGYTLSKEAFEHYHRIVDGDGMLHNGKHAIEDNLPGKTFKNGTYAAHTLHLNSGNIGVSILAMGGAKWADPRNSTNYPVMPRQVDAFCKEIARLALVYSIPVDRKFILTHAEVQPTLGVTQKNKWDFDYDPRYFLSTRNPIGIGDELRQEVQHIIHGILPDVVTKPMHVQQKLPNVGTISQGSEGPDVYRLQTALNAWLTFTGSAVNKLVRDSRFGPSTRDALILFQKKHQLLPDGVAGPLTWATLLYRTGA